LMKMMNESSKANKRVGSVLVVGGGIGGIQVSLDLAESGFKVYVVDTSPSIGGVMARLDKTFPTNDCAMCILSPKLVDAGRHRNVEVLTYSEVEGVSGDAGNFLVSIRELPRYVDAEKCTGCGMCAEYCPVVAIDGFNEGLSGRAAVYIDYPQAVPLVFMIDREKCVGCGLCENICLAGAIKYNDQERLTELNVGAIILAPGVKEFDARLKSEFGYGRYFNVVSSVEFERILSASGPFRGRLQRPSDGVVPVKVAFLQCVGSRDESCGNGYCSSVCCMYAAKEAVIAKEHENQVEPTIFYMDMRAYGKDFDRYIERAREEYGVRFVRCRVASIQEDPVSRDLVIRYEMEGGELVSEEFNLVVLSVGVQPSDRVMELAERVGVELDRYGFCVTGEFSPLETSRPGVFVCGMFSSPKDIPETVTQASAAAAQVGTLLSLVRGSLVKEKEYPQELDVRGQPPRIGVFVCHCGINIGGVVDVPSVVEYLRTLPNIVYVCDNLYTCSSDTQELIKESIKKHRLNRVIVASCTPRTHEPLFRETISEVGLNPYLFEMANIRDQDSWVHRHNPEAATEKAKDLVRMAVAKVRTFEPLERVLLNILPRGLVIGGGLSGMTTALAMAEQGFEVYLVEKERELGGFLQNIYYTLEGRDPVKYLQSLIKKVTQNDLIHIFLEAELNDISGYVGNFATTITQGKKKRTFEHGVIIVATGGEAYKPNDYLYGKDDRVITQSELEKCLSTYQFENSDTVVMIQCVGSRDDQHPYCSRVCCSEALKNALKIKERSSKTEVFILYRDVRTYGLMESYYTKAREKGVIFIRYDKDEKPKVTIQTSKDGRTQLFVTLLDPILGEEILIAPDLVVLSVGIIPPKDTKALSQMLKVPINRDGFFSEAHVKLRPVDFATEGIFLCGLAHSPKSINESIAQAYAAASRAIIPMAKGQIQSEAITAHVDEEACIGCGLCISMCPYNAAEFVRTHDDKWVSKINEILCKGCGACAVICPKMAIEMYHFKRDQIVAQIRSSFIIPTEGEFEPKIIIFTCNWCSYAGADLAGVNRIQYPASVRIIRLMCSGRVDPLFIFEALSSGADGVLITGCHPGECHYISGNLWAEARYESIKLWIKEIGIEPERLRLSWISASEGGKFAQVIKEMVMDIKKLGPNPLTSSIIVKEV
jgi:heterodisulfide reductase subunit A